MTSSQNDVALLAHEAGADVANYVQRITKDALSGRPANTGTVKSLIQALRDHADTLAETIETQAS